MVGLSSLHKLDSLPKFDLRPLLITTSILKSVSRSRRAGGGRLRLNPFFRGLFVLFVERGLQSGGLLAHHPKTHLSGVAGIRTLHMACIESIL